MTIRPIPHSPLGANASLTLGSPDLGCGFAINSVFTPLDLLVGRRASASEPWELLPFYQPHQGLPAPLPKGRFGRFVAASGDKWMIGPLVFKLCTPFPVDRTTAAEESEYVPVVSGYLEYDNTHSDEPAELVFGLGSRAQTIVAADHSAFHVGGRCGVATPVSPEVQSMSGDKLFKGGPGGGLAFAFSVPAHAKRVYPVVVGFFDPTYFYSQYLSSIADVLSAGLKQHSARVAASDAIDSEFMRSTLGFTEKQVLIEQLRAWLADSRRLISDPPLDLSSLQAIWSRRKPNS